MMSVRLMCERALAENINKRFSLTSFVILSTSCNSIIMLSEEGRARIIYLKGRGLGPTAIARDLGIGLNTVRRWLDKYAQTGVMSPSPIPGRPRVTSPDDDQTIVRTALSDRTASLSQIRSQVSDLPHPPCRETIRQRLLEGGLRSRVQMRKDVALTRPSVMSRRLEWARQRLDSWTAYSRDSTVYVDESSFCTATNFRRTEWRPESERGRGFQYVGGSGWTSVSVFGGLCGSELLPLYVCSGTFTGDQYRDVLSELYWPVLRDKFGTRPFTFQQDNSPVHRSAAVREWAETEPDFQKAILFQPPYSPCLNPIEHVWARMKRNLRDKNLRGRGDLTEAIVNEWNTLSENAEFLCSLSGSMPDRLEAVIAARGGATKY